MLPYVAMYYPMMASVLPDLSRIYEKQLESFAQDVDLIHNVRLGREPLSYASLQLARKFRVPFILTPVHHPRWVGWRYKAYLELYQMADAIVAMTNSEKETLTSLGVEPGRIFVSGMGPVLAPSSDPSGFVTKHRLKGPVILFLGQHFPYKGHRQVLEAAAIVWKRFPETHFVFIGPSVGGSEKIYKIYKDVRIHRMHNVNLQEKTDAIASSTMLCVPSMQESFGGVYTEAWSFSKPVIGCRIPAVSEVIDDTVNGLLVRQDPQEIANAICMLLSDEKLSKQLGESGKRKVEAQYTWARIAKRTEEAYLAAVRETRPE